MADLTPVDIIDGTGAVCTLPAQTIKGIAVSYVLTNGKRQWIVAGLDAGRTNSAAFFGVR